MNGNPAQPERPPQRGAASKLPDAFVVALVIGIIVLFLLSR